ncbi:hypothetical protein DID96_29060 [Burkholderia sp. Bp8963]|uniref:hypothetical protein n=1 Tax=Burkholderia sp. Bp8963 TaxID=2184547 RepID=UPI000F5AC28B|nr:hypothetical protein [Burkholderia sp. Bp8963]RQS64118.1 hypothetical protein DID96_29060 [Burkholderia sp. Bp8963]
MTQTAPHLLAPRLDAVSHWRIEPPFACADADWLDRAERAGRVAGTQLQHALRATGFEPQSVMVLSTIMDSTFTAPQRAVARFVAAIASTSGHAPQGIVSAYLCASWGFALRHLQRNTALTRIALLIVDLDVHDMAWHLDHPLTGRSGFGTTTLLFSLPRAPAALRPECSGPHPNSAYSEFVMALRRHAALAEPAACFIPFTRTPLHATARAALGGTPLAPNRYDAWGHCFGADPWIGLIEHLAPGPHPAPLLVLCGAIALNGYYTLCPIALHDTLFSEFRHLDGAAERIDRALADQPAAASCPT